MAGGAAITNYIVKERIKAFKKEVLSIFDREEFRVHGLKFEGIMNLLENKRRRIPVFFDERIVLNLLEKLIEEGLVYCTYEENERVFFLEKRK